MSYKPVPIIGLVNAPSLSCACEGSAVEFGVEIGEYHGVVRVPRRVFQRLLPERPLPSGASKATT